MQTRLAEVGPAFVDQVRAIADEGRLDDTFIDAGCDPPAVSASGMIAHVLAFAAHRRMLVCGSMVGAGVGDLGAGDPMHSVAEHACRAGVRAGRPRSS